MNEETNYREDFLSRASELGWEIIFEDKNGIQLKRKKTYSAGLVLLGLVLTLFAIGLIVWLFGLVDYLSKSDEIIYIKKNDLIGTEHAAKVKALIEKAK